MGAPPVGARPSGPSAGAEPASATALRHRTQDLVDRTRALPAGADGDEAAEHASLAAGLEEVADDLRAAMRRARTADRAELAVAARDLVAVTRLQGELRERLVAQRFGTVARIHRSLGRLRDRTTVADLLPAAAEELGRSCGFDRAAISRRTGSRWQAEAIWIAPGVHPQVARRTRAFLSTKWIPLGPGTVEAQLVQRRTASLVSAEDPGVDRSLIDATSSGRYVATPILAGDRVVGFAHGDRFGGGRTVDEVDRDNLWSFAEGFGLVFERVALLERLADRRDQIREAFAEVEDGLVALGRDELQLDRDAATSDGSVAVRPPEDGATAVLTAREREVVDLMARGARNREIAERLVIGEATVKSHVRAIGRKLQAGSRADAVARYLRLASGPPA